MANRYISVEEVPVWQEAHRLVLSIYKLTRGFPNYELYGLTSQLRRSSSSIPTNITEGFYRNTTKELIMFLYNARGSCGETIYHLKLVYDLGYIKKNSYDELRDCYDNVAKQLNGWIKSLKTKK